MPDRLWVPRDPGTVDDSAWLRPLLAALEDAAAAAGDGTGGTFKRDVVRNRVLCQWGEPPLAIGLAVPEPVIFAHPYMTTGMLRAGAALLVEGVGSIIERRARPDQVTSSALAQDVPPLLDVRWATQVGTIALFVLADDLQARADAGATEDSSE